MISLKQFLDTLLHSQNVMKIEGEDSSKRYRGHYSGRGFKMETMEWKGKYRYDLWMLSVDSKEANNPSKETDYYLVDKWEVGGRSGGNYMGGKAEAYVTTPESTEPEQFDRALEKFTDVSFLTYKRLSRDLLKSFAYWESEYYGNGTNYQGKMVKVEDLYNALVKEDLFKQEYKEMESIDFSPVAIEAKQEPEKVSKKKTTTKKLSR